MESFPSFVGGANGAMKNCLKIRGEDSGKLHKNRKITYTMAISRISWNYSITGTLAGSGREND
jgi:hypothetical protein